MRSAAILSVALALAACRSGGAGTAPARPATPREVIASARATIEQWRQAYQVRSFEALSQLYAHDLDLVVVQDGQALVGWSSVEAAIKERFARYPRIEVRLKDIQVVSLGETGATATASLTREIGDDTTTVHEGGALTVVLRREPAGWVIVAEHYSNRRGA